MACACTPEVKREGYARTRRPAMGRMGGDRSARAG